jgi:hypothetical protein
MNNIDEEVSEERKNSMYYSPLEKTLLEKTQWEKNYS